LATYASPAVKQGIKIRDWAPRRPITRLSIRWAARTAKHKVEHCILL